MTPLEKLRTRFASRGVPHPDFAATVTVARGRTLLDEDAFAATLGVPASHVRSWESGNRSPDHVPRRIADVAPDLDWHAAGVTPPGHASDPASRHPSARQRRTPGRPVP